MPGVFGAIAVRKHRDPRPVADSMQNLLVHQDWYATVLDQRDNVTLGAVSTNPWFRETSNLAQRPEARLIIEGTAVTIDGQPVPADADDLADRLLNVYLEDAEGLPRRLGGHFNLVVQDWRRDCIQLINDRVGFAHMYWYADNDVFLFGPELKSFLAWSDFDRTVDEGSFGAFLVSQCPLGTRTLFQKVSMLAPATRLTWSNGEVSIDRYWRPEPQPETGRDIDDLLDEAMTLYERSISKRIAASWNERVVIPLSGGLDSRLLVWLLRSHGDRLDLYTHGQDGCTDAVYGREAAEAVGVAEQHKVVTIDPDWAGENARRAVWLNDGQLNLRNATLIGISETVGPQAVPFLNGIIGPHMSLGVGGFVKPEDLRPITDEDELRSAVIANMGMGKSLAFLRSIMAADQADRMSSLAQEQAWESFDDYRHIESFGDQKILHINANFGRRMQGTVDVHKYFFHDLVPFADDELFQLWLRIPMRDRMGNGLYQEMYRRRIPELAAVPWAQTGLGLFATEAELQAAAKARANRRQRQTALRKFSFGLINLQAKDSYNHREVWLRKQTAFRRVVRDTLSDVNATGCDWLDQQAVDGLFRKFDRGADHLLRPLMQVATTVIWHDQFLGHSEHQRSLGDLTSAEPNV